ncbi:hypothetical protein BH11PSE5_BH11PSE5_21310 [soil metagenome]
MAPATNRAGTRLKRLKAVAAVLNPLAFEPSFRTYVSWRRVAASAASAREVIPSLR